MISNTFICSKCTRRGILFADTPEGVFRIAHAIGWRQETDGPRLICSRCPGGNAKGNLSLVLAEQLEKALQASFRDPEFAAKVAEMVAEAEKGAPAGL